MNSGIRRVFQNANVIDGTGSPATLQDVAIQGDQIVAMGHNLIADARYTMDCTGKVLTPGFIDIHTHSDFNILLQPGMESSLSQGVTTEIFGNCGIAIGLATNADVFVLERRALDKAGTAINWDDMQGFLTRLADQGVALNVASLAGHGTMRKRVMGISERQPSPSELLMLCRDAENAMRAGAVGLSSGLEYVPGIYADVNELATLARVVHEWGGFYATHLRDEGDFLYEAVSEAISVARISGIRLQLSHHKAELRRNWGKIASTLQLVSDSIDSGMDILLDQYPYTAYQTSLQTIVIPRWANAADPDGLARTLAVEASRKRIEAEMAQQDWAAIRIANCQHHQDYVGKSLADIALDKGVHPAQFVLDLLAEGGPWISAVHHAMSPEDVATVMQDPRVMIGSDSVATDSLEPSLDQPHPRTFGTFATVLGTYVRDKNVLTLPDAIRKMTSLPASRLRWQDRGRLAIGYKADLVLLDPDVVGATATFEAPRQRAAGIEQVWVNGVLAHEKGLPTGSRSGHVYRA